MIYLFVFFSYIKIKKFYYLVINKIFKKTTIPLNIYNIQKNNIVIYYTTIYIIKQQNIYIVVMIIILLWFFIPDRE